jgi:hypothetical protein
VTDTATSNHVYVLPRYNSTLADEYYLIEKRGNAAALPLHDDDGIFDDGIAVWHIVSDINQMTQPPIGVTTDFWNTAGAGLDADDVAQYGQGTQTRWGVRLLRSFESLNMDGTANFQSKNNTLWDKTEYDLHSGACPAVFLGEHVPVMNVLAWADCTPSGYHIEFKSLPAASMQVEVSID